MAKASRGLDFALQAGQGIIGAGMGLLLQKGQDRRQINQQKKLQALEIGGQKQMTDYNMAKQLQMWKDTNYAAQMAELSKAGLNPGLIYGMGGAGGATTGTPGANVTGAHAPVGGGEAIAMAGMGIQAGLMRAQKANIEANTNKTNIEANKIGGVDTDKTKTEIGSLAQGIENAKAQQKLTEVETRLKAIEEKVKGGQFMIEAQQDLIVNEAAKGVEEITILETQKLLDRAQMIDKINLLQTQLIETATRAALAEAQTKTQGTQQQVNAAQITKWAAEVQQNWHGVWQRDTENLIKAFEAEFRVNNPGISQALGRIISKITDEVNQKTKPILGETKDKKVPTKY